MARKAAAESWTVCREDNGMMLISRQHRKEWRFHAFIGDLFASEGEAKSTVETLVKSKAIPNVKYNVRYNVRQSR